VPGEDQQPAVLAGEFGDHAGAALSRRSVDQVQVPGADLYADVVAVCDEDGRIAGGSFPVRSEMDG
jgi:hypothetical protein